MSDYTYLPDKDPSAVEPFFIIWCDPTGINTGALADKGELQGATIATATWTVPTGITKDSSNQGAVTINGTTYAVNTVTTIWLSGGTSGQEYTLRCVITTSDSPSRTLPKSIVIPVRAH